jgi:hypothetical protein
VFILVFQTNDYRTIKELTNKVYQLSSSSHDDVLQYITKYKDEKSTLIKNIRTEFTKIDEMVDNLTQPQISNFNIDKSKLIPIVSISPGGILENTRCRRIDYLILRGSYTPTVPVDFTGFLFPAFDRNKTYEQVYKYMSKNGNVYVSSDIVRQKCNELMVKASRAAAKSIDQPNMYTLPRIFEINVYIYHTFANDIDGSTYIEQWFGIHSFENGFIYPEKVYDMTITEPSIQDSIEIYVKRQNDKHKYKVHVTATVPKWRQLVQFTATKVSTLHPESILYLRTVLGLAQSFDRNLVENSIHIDAYIPNIPGIVEICGDITSYIIPNMTAVMLPV